MAYIRLSAFQDKLPFSYATMIRKITDGTFPQPTKISERIKVWESDEIELFLKGEFVPRPNLSVLRQPKVQKLGVCFSDVMRDLDNLQDNLSKLRRRLIAAEKA